MIIRLYDESDRRRWDDYVQQHPNGTFFHLISWKHVIEKSFGHQSFYLTAEQDNRIVGVFPLFGIKSILFGNYLVSIPFAELGGILSDHRDIADMLLKQGIDIAKNMRCDYLEIRNRDQMFDFPTKSLYYNFRKEMFPDADKNFEAIPRKARRMIRQGMKFGLKSEFGNDQIHDFYDIMARSFHHLGTPIFPRQFFRNFIKTFDKNVLILMVRNADNIPVSGVLSFFFKDEVLPYYAGSLPEYRNLAPNDFMYWELMRFGCENGYRIFDFGRSKKDTGSYHFKRHWGFEPVQLSYQYCLIRSKEMPNLSPANPKYRKKIDMWKKLPLSVTKIIGPPVARFLA